MKNHLQYCLFLLISLGGLTSGYAQTCDSLVPSFVADLSSKADSLWSSPFSARNGYCCSATGVDKCIEFKVTKHSSAVGVIVDITDGALPGGALYVRTDCGPEIPLGDTVFLSTNGPHNITFCKPGDNNNVYSIQSVTLNTAITEKANGSNNITIYPNPSVGTIKINLQSTTRLRFKIIDLYGKLYSEGELNPAEEIDISQLSKGLYFIEVADNKGNFIEQHKVVKY